MRSWVAEPTWACLYPQYRPSSSHRLGCRCWSRCRPWHAEAHGDECVTCPTRTPRQRPPLSRNLVKYLAERDGTACGICRKAIDVTKPAADGGPSIDHVIPWSMGGSDDPANLRLAHLTCNVRRGNRGGGEQLMLVG